MPGLKSLKTALLSPSPRMARDFVYAPCAYFNNLSREIEDFVETHFDNAKAKQFYKIPKDFSVEMR